MAAVQIRGTRGQHHANRRRTDRRINNRGEKNAKRTDRLYSHDRSTERRRTKITRPDDTTRAKTLGEPRAIFSYSAIVLISMRIERTRQTQRQKKIEIDETGRTARVRRGGERRAKKSRKNRKIVKNRVLGYGNGRKK